MADKAKVQNNRAEMMKRDDMVNLRYLTALN